ncbi:MAG: TonB-dependent receptor, partial [Croceibacterium sp.]
LTNSYNYNPETDVIGTFSSAERLQYGSENYVGRYTGNMADWLVVSAAYGKSKLRDSTLPLDTVRPYVVDNRTSPPAIIGNASNIIELAQDEREFFRFDADWYFDLFGSHHVRVGYDNESLTSDNRTVYTGNAAYNYYTAGAGDIFAPQGVDYVAARTFVSGGLFKTKNEAFYIQDNWSLFDNRLQLQLGIRNDRFKNFNADGDVFYSSGDQWGPRAGFTFDVFGDQKAKLYGSFGRYYLPIPSNTNIRLAGAEYDLTRYNRLLGVNSDGTPIIGAPLVGFEGADSCYDTSINNCENVSDGTANPTEALVSKNLKPQSVDEFILGGEVRMGGGWKFGLYGTYRKLNESLEDVAIDAAVQAYCDENQLDCNTASGSPIWSGFHQYVLVNPGAASTITLSDFVNGESTLRTIDFSAADLGYPQAKRTYKAITATFEREFDGVWSLQGSYTYSQNKGNIEGGVKSDNGQDDSGITTDFDQPGFTVGSYGYLPNHRAHNFKAFGSYQVTDWLMVGANGSVTSPRKFGCIGRVPASVDAFAGAYGAAGFFCNVKDGKIVTDPTGFTVLNPATGTTTLQSTPRGSVFQSDWQTELNLSAVFKIPTEKYDASLRFDVFNVFNSQAALDFEERGTLNNGTPRREFGLPTGFQTPRFVRLQFQIGF